MKAFNWYELDDDDNGWKNFSTFCLNCISIVSGKESRKSNGNLYGAEQVAHYFAVNRMIRITSFSSRAANEMKQSKTKTV